MAVEITHPDSTPDVPFVSYSSFSQWLECGKRWELRRIHKVPERPGWWFPGGSAVHSATEEYDHLLFAQEGK